MTPYTVCPVHYFTLCNLKFQPHLFPLCQFGQSPAYTYNLCICNRTVNWFIFQSFKNFWYRKWSLGEQYCYQSELYLQQVKANRPMGMHFDILSLEVKKIIYYIFIAYLLTLTHIEDSEIQYAPLYLWKNTVRNHYNIAFFHVKSNSSYKNSVVRISSYIIQFHILFLYACDT